MLNAFDRQMCEEMRDAWRRVKDDPSVHAVVLRAAGDRAFCAGLDTSKPYGQPDDVWNHEDPGELLSPKWQQVWKPVVCAVHGICTAGAFYFVNEADIVICSDDATFFDSHVTYGLVSALEPVGLMRKIGLGETLRIALSGNDERVTAATALRIGLVTEVVARADLWSRAHEIAAGIARKPTAATQGTVRAIWESLDRPVPRRDAAGPDLHAARQPDRHGRGRRAGRRPSGPEAPLMARAAARRSATASRRCSALDPPAPALEFEQQWYSWGDLGARPPTRSRRTSSRASGSRSCCATGRRRSVCVLGLLRAGACVVTTNPERGTERVRADLESLGVGTFAGERADLDAFAPQVALVRRATRSAPSTSPAIGRRRPRPANCARVSRSRCSRAGRPGRRSGCRSPTRRSRACSTAPSTTSATPTPTCGCAAASRSSTRRSCTSAGCSASCSASTTAVRSACSSGSGSTSGPTRCAVTARAR